MPPTTLNSEEPDKGCCFFVSGVAFHNTIQGSILFDYVIAKAQVYPRKHRA